MENLLPTLSSPAELISIGVLSLRAGHMCKYAQLWYCSIAAETLRAGIVLHPLLMYRRYTIATIATVLLHQLLAYLGKNRLQIWISCDQKNPDEYWRGSLHTNTLLSQLCGTQHVNPKGPSQVSPGDFPYSGNWLIILVERKKWIARLALEGVPAYKYLYLVCLAQCVHPKKVRKNHLRDSDHWVVIWVERKIEMTPRLALKGVPAYKIPSCKTACDTPSRPIRDIQGRKYHKRTFGHWWIAWSE